MWEYRKLLICIFFSQARLSNTVALRNREINQFEQNYLQHLLKSRTYDFYTLKAFAKFLQQLQIKTKDDHVPICGE